MNLPSYVSLQPFDLKYGRDTHTFYIEVHEGSELLHINPIVRSGIQGFEAWCLISPGLPFTRRFFRFMGPGTTVYNRHDLEYVGPVYEIDGILWLVFEDVEARLQWVKENKCESS